MGFNSGFKGLTQDPARKNFPMGTYLSPHPVFPIKVIQVKNCHHPFYQLSWQKYVSMQGLLRLH